MTKYGNRKGKVMQTDTNQHTKYKTSQNDTRGRNYYSRQLIIKIN